MPKTFLAIGAHMDDCEIGAGGVLLQAVRAGYRVVVVTVVSDYKSWAPTIGREEKTKHDLLAVAKRFGYEKLFLDYKYHQTNGRDVSFKQVLSRLQYELKPDVAFIHHHEDLWPDHLACAEASQDALLFPHGLSGDLNAPRVPLVYSFAITPMQTVRFEPDSFYDVTDVAAQYMELILNTDACLAGKTPEAMVKFEFNTLEAPAYKMKLGDHGMTTLTYLLQNGYRTGCTFAQGFKTVWGQRRGVPLF